MEEKIAFCILDADYDVENGKSVVTLWGKTKEGKSILVLDRGFDPYFYVEPKPELSKEDIEVLKNRILGLEIEGKKPKRVEELDKKFLGKPVHVLKVVIDQPPDVPKFRSLLKDWTDVKEEYEYGISFARRYLIDKRLIPMGWASVEGEEIKRDENFDIILDCKSIEMIEGDDYPPLHILAFDIEVVQEGGEEKIIMVSFMDNRKFKKVITYGKERVKGAVTVSNEEGLIKRFLDTIKERNPDTIVGYNTDRYDFLKLDKKSEKYKIPMILGRNKKNMVFGRRGRISAARINGRLHIDLYDFVEHILGASLSTEVLTLDRVAKELLGIGKEKMRWKELTDAWNKKDLHKIAQYCLLDSELTLKLADYLLPQIFELSRVSGQIPFDASRMTYSQLVEWLFIRKAFSVNELAPNRPKYGEVMRRRRATPYTGGYVHLPKEGIHENIALFDFQSLYPTITITHNVSPEMIDCGDCPANRRNKIPDTPHYFCGKQRGFVPMVIEELVKKRSEIKEKMEKTKPRSVLYKSLQNRQYALKIIANASYGYYGYAGSRWYSRICAEAITSWGRMYIKKVISMAEKMGSEVIYGDTDSLFLKMKGKKQAKEFLTTVNESLPGVMELDFRDIYKLGIFVLGKTGVAAKKRYALIDKDGKIVIRGFEKVRRDWASIAKDAQERVLLAILRDKSPEKAVKIVRNIIDNLKKGKVNFDDLVIYSQITKPISEYEQIGPHVAAAKKALEMGRVIKQGSVIGYVITKGTGSISDRAEPAEIAKSYDPIYYTKHQVVPAALRIMSVLGYTEEDLTSKKRIEQISLEKYIK